MTIDINELRRLMQDFKLAGSPMLVQTAQMSELLDRLEAAEEERSNFILEIGKLCAQCDALRAKITEMERQEIGFRERCTPSSPTGYSNRFPRYALPGAHPKPDCGEAGHDEGRCGNRQCLPGAQPAPSIKDAIIDDLQSQFDSEGITEHDSGDALIRLSDAIAAVEDNFVQSAQSVPDGWKLVPIEPTQEMINRVIDERLDALAAGKDHTFIDIYKAMLAAAPKPEAKP